MERLNASIIIWALLNNSNADDIICETVNLYGDLDTIGAIAGGLAI